MGYEYDQKGKIYTDVIRKTAYPAVIQTTKHLVEGLVHVKEGDRFKDELDNGVLFLAVTEAKILNLDGTVFREAAFLSIARSQIVWVIPGDEPKKRGE